MDISERSFEETIEHSLLSDGPADSSAWPAGVREEPPPYGENVPDGYRKRAPEEYDRALCLVPRGVVDFILATQPKEWTKLKQHHGAEVRERFLKRLSLEIERRGALDVLRNMIKDSGCKFRLAYFRPASGLNEEMQRLHAANLFAVVRQLHYSEKDQLKWDALKKVRNVVQRRASVRGTGLLWIPEKLPRCEHEGEAAPRIKFLLSSHLALAGTPGESPLLHPAAPSRQPTRQISVLTIQAASHSVSLGQPGSTEPTKA